MAVASKRELLYEIKIDDKGTVVIEKLGVKTKDAGKAFDALTKDIEKNTTAGKLSASAIQAQINQLKKLRDENTKNNKLYREQSVHIMKLENDLHALTDVTGEQVKRNANMIDKTGLAGATVQEFGRTISDSNYGIRGMANNLQQLSSLFITLVSTSGGLIAGLQQLGKVLIGPLGIVILFQTFITLLEGGKINLSMFAEGVKELNKAMREGAKNAGDEVAQLNILVQTANNAALSTEKRQIAVEKLNKDYPEFLENISLEEIGTNKVNVAIAKQIELITRRSQVEAITNAIQEEQSKILEENNKTVLERISAIGKGVQLIRNFGNVSKTIVGEVSRVQEQSEKRNERSNKTIEKLQLELQKLLEETPSIVDQLYGTDEDESDAENKLDERLRRIKSLTDRYKKAVAVDDAADRLTQLEQQRDFALAEAEELKAGEELKELIRLDFEQKIQAEMDRQAARDEADQLRKDRNAEKDKLRQLRLNQAIIRYQQNRLKAEQSIEIQKVQFARQISDTLSAIAGEGTALAKAAIVIEKGAAIADIVIKAQQSIATQTASAQAANLQAQAAYASIPFVGPALAAAQVVKNNALLAKGISMTKIGAGLSIATILATTLASKKTTVEAPIPTTTAPASTPIQAPAFNVVGATQTSQLAQTIAGAEDRPVKAFVVASDVTTAQELERSTIEGASLG